MNVPDPWAVERPAPRTRRWGPVPVVVGAWVLGAAGPVAQAQRFGESQARAGALLAGAMVLLAASLRLRPPAARGAGAAASVALALAGPASTLGRTPVLLAALGVAVADLALGGRWYRHRATPAAGPAPLAFPLLALAGVAWFRLASPPTSIGLIGLGLAAVAVSQRAPASVRAAERAVERATTTAAHLVASAITFVVALVVVYLPGAVAAGVLAVVRRRRSATSWSVRTLDQADHRRGAGHSFAPAEPSSRRRQLGFGSLLGLILVAGLVTWIRTRPPEVVLQAVDPITGSTVPAPTAPPGTTPPADTTQPTDPPPIEGLRYSETEAGAGLSWADQVQQDQSAQQLPPDVVAGYGSGDLTSSTTNVADGVRRTLRPPRCECPTTRIWFAGGSVAFGVGQRDDHTIPSALVRAAASDDLALDIANIAVPGHTLWQEYQVVLARLATATTRPDMVIFYDGFNDMIGTFQQAIIADHDFSVPVVYDPSAFAAIRSQRDSVGDRLEALGGTEALARQAAGRYTRLVGVIRRQLAALDVDSQFFYQPDFTASPAQRASIMRSYPELGADVVEPLTAFLAFAAREQTAPVHELHDLFDDHPAPVFFDLAHTNEEGAQLVAAAMYDTLLPTLSRLAGQASD
ncbi:MAG: hypothetical protein JWM47_408 [Acidimicrobiales bacterium]|nr:hypothetical protein [Acidimicrobiales bacterium]